MLDTPALSRWWREPWWARLLLALILFCSAALTAWNLGRGVDFAFYEASARSMSESWRALLFGAFDPAATVTLDKLSGFAVPQALSVRLFGMSTAALALPQVIEGLMTVFACALVGLRWMGRSTGLVAAAAAAVTPIFVSMFGHPMEDGLLTMALAVALVWWQRAVLTARWWPLLMAGLFIGIGFQAKMAQAWFPLPALVVGTVLAVAGPWRRRLGAAVVLAGSALAASLSWMLLIQLTPQASRPFVDGTTDDDVFAMVFGYNGVDRFLSDAVPGAVHVAAAAQSPAGELATLTKLVDPLYMTQIGWLYPAALVGVLWGLWRWWRPGRGAPTAGERRRRALFVVLVVWLLTSAAVLSAARMPHAAYLAAIGVQLALLSAFAVSEALRVRASASPVERAMLPGLISLQAGWAVLLAIWGGTPIPLTVAIVGVSVAGVLAVALGASAPRAARRVAIPVAISAIAAVLAGPALYSVQALDGSRDGSGIEAYVGVKPTRAHVTPETFAISPPDPWGGAPQIDLEQTQLLAAVRAAGGGADGSPLFMTDSWSLAAPIIDATGQEVLADGGYTGQAPVFTAEQVRQRIADGVHLVVLRDGAAVRDPMAEVVHSDACGVVASWSAHREEAVSSSPGGRGQELARATRGGFTLYACS